jgi:hypothetical protein
MSFAGGKSTAAVTIAGARSPDAAVEVLVPGNGRLSDIAVRRNGADAPAETVFRDRRDPEL